MEIDYTVMTNNIRSFLAKNNMNIGDFEKLINVSTGYVSRLEKVSSAKPNVPVVLQAADILGVSVKSLLFTDLTGYFDLEEKLLHFLVKLDNDTIENKINWAKVKSSELTNDDSFLPEDQNFPKINKDTIKKAKKCLESSLSFGKYWYYFQLENGAYFCLLSIEGDWELWMVSQAGINEFVCSSGENPNLTTALKDLVCDVENKKSINLSKNALDTISAYMKEV